MLPLVSFVLLLSAVRGHNAPACRAPLARLSDGQLMPTYGFGTWLGAGVKVKETDDSVEKAVEAAIDAGYRHIDTASIYDDEIQVGRAVNNKINEGVVKREDLFITTKLWNDKHAREDVLPALQESLEKLNTTYVDLYLIHWPFATKTRDYKPYVDIDYLETWQGMVEAKQRGLARSIGVCNFNLRQMERLLNSSDVKPSVLQVELNLNLQQPELRRYCHSNQIAVVAYTPFGSLFPSKAKPDAPPPRIDHPALLAIANKYNKTVPQLALRYLYELGVTPIPKSVSKTRIEENLDIFDFQLDEFEREQLKGFDANYKVVDVSFWKDSPDYPF